VIKRSEEEEEVVRDLVKAGVDIDQALIADSLRGPRRNLK